MDKKEIKKIDTMIHELDTAGGMLLVASMKDNTVKKAWEKITKVSINLGSLVDKYIE